MLWLYSTQRTQISLTTEERRALDVEAARTGRSVSALIRDAVDTVYGEGRSSAEDLAELRHAFGAWTDRHEDGAADVEHPRTGARLAHDR